MSNQNITSIWTHNDQQTALKQIAGLCKKCFDLPVVFSRTDNSFVLQHHQERKTRRGVLSVSGQIKEDRIIDLQVEVARGSDSIRVRADRIFDCLSRLGGKVRIIQPQEKTKTNISLWLQLLVDAIPLSPVRESSLLDELQRINELSIMLQAEMPQYTSFEELRKPYEEFTDILEVIPPIEGLLGKEEGHLNTWACKTVDYLSGSQNITLVSPHTSILNICLAFLARVSLEIGSSLALIKIPSINSKGVVDIATKAPGFLVIPTAGLNLGSNMYEIGNDIHSLLALLTTINKPAIFTGTMDHLQAVFAGGQGGKADPLFPVVLHVPDISVESVIRFETHVFGRQAGGLSEEAELEITAEILALIRGLPADRQFRVVPSAVRLMVQEWNSGKERDRTRMQSYLANISSLSETLSGLSTNPRGTRNAEVQNRYVSVLTGPQLLISLKQSLFAQDRALEQLAARLAMEALTRPSEQPIRYCAQGTPGTGKSESAAILARCLEIPYVNIDAASMPDYHTAASQLLGSGRGIVMSNKAGRLEQVAKHHTGVVLEISDLDHAAPSVRSALADLFLQVLETGEAQSATGAMFFCSNIIFVFTMNLPNGADENVRKSMGFNSSISAHDLQERVISEIKLMLSGAFLSRVGTPILFDPLNGNTLKIILEKTIIKSIRVAAERFELPVCEVILAERTGDLVVRSLSKNITTFGARALLEHGRTIVAKAIIEFRQQQKKTDGERLLVSADSEGNLHIHSD